jgi:glycosyltransferase involved in cell wall biosynthesis
MGSSLLFKCGMGVVILLGCEEMPDIEKEVPSGIEKSGIIDVLLDDKRFKMVYLAQFRPGKMHVWLVKALIPILKANPQLCLILCGMGSEIVINEVKSVIKRNNLSRQVLMPGQIPRYEVPWLLKHVNCAIVPSRAETFGHNYLEPMFAGLPVVGTRVGIGREVIEDGVTGFGFSLKKPAGLRQAISKFIESPSLAKNMGFKAYERVRNTFRHSDVAIKLVKLYQELLTDK